MIIDYSKKKGQMYKLKAIGAMNCRFLRIIYNNYYNISYPHWIPNWKSFIVIQTINKRLNRNTGFFSKLIIKFIKIETKLFIERFVLSVFHLSISIYKPIKLKKTDIEKKTVGKVTFWWWTQLIKLPLPVDQ